MYSIYTFICPYIYPISKWTDGQLNNSLFSIKKLSKGPNLTVHTVHFQHGGHLCKNFKCPPPLSGQWWTVWTVRSRATAPNLPFLTFC